MRENYLTMRLLWVSLIILSGFTLSVVLIMVVFNILIY